MNTPYIVCPICENALQVAIYTYPGRPIELARTIPDHYFVLAYPREEVCCAGSGKRFPRRALNGAGAFAVGI